MKELFKKYKFILIFVLLAILACFFPLSGKALAFRALNVNGFSDIFVARELGLFSNILSAILAKIDVLRILIYGVFGGLLFMDMRNIVDKKNGVLMFIGAFFFLLLDKNIFASSYVNLTGFVSYFIGSLFLLILMNLFTKNKIGNMKKLPLFVLGLLGTTIKPTYSFVFLATTLMYLFVDRGGKSNKNKGAFLLVGEILGLVISALNQRLVYTGVSHNLLHGFIPLLAESNFIIVLIKSAMILIASIKIFSSGRRLKITFSMFGILSFLFSSLLSTSVILQYITYIFYTVGSLYLLLNIRPSEVFNRRVGYYFVFNVVTILFMCIFGDVNAGSMLFLSILDILLILEFYDGTLPKNFLSNVWLSIFVLLAGANIYIYSNTMSKFKEMNVYIKNKLECTRGDYSIPNKYYTEYLDDYIPQNREELEQYIEYYGIVPLGDVDGIELRFKR